jgi:hypothetical protein
MRNIEAPKALSQFRAWGIAPGDQIAWSLLVMTKEPGTWTKALKARFNSAVVFNPQRTRGGGGIALSALYFNFTHASWGAASG